MIGLAVGSAVMQNDMVDAIDKSAMKPVIDRSFELEELDKAFEYQESGKHLGRLWWNGDLNHGVHRIISRFVHRSLAKVKSYAKETQRFAKKN